MIVGAHALAFHGAPRYTGDLDVYIRPTVENGRRLIHAIAAFGFPTDALSAESVTDRNRILEMGVPPVQIYVMSAIDGVAWDEVHHAAAPGRFGPHEVSFIGRAQYFKNKRAAARPKDLADVAALEGDEPA